MERPIAEVLQYEGPPKDMLRGPSGPAPINLPPRTRRNAVSATHAGPTDLELWMQNQAMSAGNSSSHFELFEAQRTKGWSPHFAAFWRNALGNLSVRALKGMRYAWKRWKEHTMECRIYWKTYKEAGSHEAIYAPCAAQLAHYFGHRSLKGKTAAAGAHTALSMCVNALGLAFPLDDKSISGWHKELKAHVPNQQTPIGVAVVKHFQYIMEHSNNPYMCSIAAAQWMNMAGMWSDALLQRSYLMKTCENACIFHCIEGKDGSKPFNWILPKLTWASGKGYECSEK